MVSSIPVISSPFVSRTQLPCPLYENQSLLPLTAPDTNQEMEAKMFSRVGLA